MVRFTEEKLMKEFNDDFYLQLLSYFEFQFSTNYPEVDFYWGKDDGTGKYYWGDRNSYKDLLEEEYLIKEEGLASLKDVVESIFSYLGLN